MASHRKTNSRCPLPILAMFRAHVYKVLSRLLMYLASLFVKVYAAAFTSSLVSSCSSLFPVFLSSLVSVFPEPSEPSKLSD